MNTTLWIVQGILAALYAMAGVMKLTQPIDKLVKTITWADRFPLTQVRLIGITELSGATGLILPWVLNIIPVLTPFAASGLALVMILAIFHHRKHKETNAIVFTSVLLILDVFVAFGRFTTL